MLILLMLYIIQNLFLKITFSGCFLLLIILAIKKNVVTAKTDIILIQKNQLRQLTT